MSGFGGFLADFVFEPFMQSGNPLALLLQRIVGSDVGSGMAVMFFCIGIFRKCDEPFVALKP